MTVGGRAEPGLAAQVRLLREATAVVPAGRQAVLVAGPDAQEYLQGQCSQDVAALAAGTSADALLLSPQGKLQALVRVTRLAADRYAVDVEDGFGDVVVERLLRFRLRVKVDVEVLPWRCLALRGPGWAGAVDPGQGVDGAVVVAPVAWNGVVGVDLLGPDPALPAGVAAVDADAWQAVRVEAGIPAMGAELDERTIPAEADLVERTVSFTKGCYTGQELVARLDARGSRVARRLRGVVVDAGPGPQHGAGLPQPGDVVRVAGREVGRLTSVAWSPALERTVALAYVHRAVEPPAAAVVVPAASLGGAEGAGDAAGTGAWPAEVRAVPLVGGR